ncbi:MAG: DUF2141 domain-containing protein [Planctomycetes bacterium]|nr:DUF2141 domain-containing protein [Planctomycetota bacterium]
MSASERIPRGLFRAVLACATLAACGADPAPVPQPALPDPDASPRGSASLAVTVEGFESAKGELYFALFFGPEGFPDASERAARGLHLPIAGTSVRAEFNDLPAGPLAVAAFHDENASGALDKNWLGLPIEPWGVSNNASAFLGPPRFQDARLELAEGQKLEVRIALQR